MWLSFQEPLEKVKHGVVATGHFSTPPQATRPVCAWWNLAVGKLGKRQWREPLIWRSSTVIPTVSGAAPNAVPPDTMITEKVVTSIFPRHFLIIQ